MSKYSIQDLRKFHAEARSFFASELMLLNEVLPRINDDKIAKAAMLLQSCGQTGNAFLLLSSQLDDFSLEPIMLARAIMEKLTNFCYVCVCDEKEFRAFVLHPIYKHYHSIVANRIEDSFAERERLKAERKERQAELRKREIVREALEMFSEVKPNLNWTKKTLNDRITTIKNSKKLLDVFFTISKIQYYSDASEALHGSLYGCTYNLGIFDIDYLSLTGDDLERKLLKDNTCVLLHLGNLIHECFTLISYSNQIDELWKHSNKNRGLALGLLMHVLEVDTDKNWEEM